MSLGETLWALINKQALNCVSVSRLRYSSPAFPALCTFPGEGRSLCWQPVLSRPWHRQSHPCAVMMSITAGSIMAAAPVLLIQTQAALNGNSAEEVQANGPGASVLVASQPSFLLLHTVGEALGHCIPARPDPFLCCRRGEAGLGLTLQTLCLLSRESSVLWAAKTRAQQHCSVPCSKTFR